MISEHIGRFFSWLRDHVARGLLRVGVRPNHLTVLGMAATVGSGGAIAAGRHWWPLAAGLIVAAGACDMLDGALAVLGHRQTRFGGILDSACDRVSDAAFYVGAAFYFIVRPDDPPATPPNLTLVLLAWAGLVWAYLISYVRARAEKVGCSCAGGFWQRGERVVTILIGVAFGHLTTVVWILGTWPVATVAHRMWRVRRLCAADSAPAERGEEPAGLLAVLLWRWKRGSLPFDIHAGTVIAMLVFWNIPPTIDPLRNLLARLVGA